MNVKVAETAGFCFGVTRAVDAVQEQIEKGNFPLYTYGPIIHNANVIGEMKEKGVIIINSVDDLPKSPAEGTIVIRSHGISRQEMEKIKDSGLKIVDATCPFVTKIHNLVEEHSRAGEYIIIIGDPKHPEVCGIRGWVSSDRVSIIQTAEEAGAFSQPKDTQICLVSQTTFNTIKFKELVEIISEKGYYINVLNTICNATEERQREARILAGCSDAMIVIGDQSSSNSQKLFEICKNECENTYFIQTENDMDFTMIQSVSNVGITAGASTPNKIIQEVSKHVRKL